MYVKPTVIEWLCLACGLFLVFHYLGFQDDSFVFFRYADNLVFMKMGLVYNYGEYVEGFSSPLWQLILVAMRYAGLDYLTIIQLTAALCFLAFWAMLVKLNRQMSPREGMVLNFPLIFLTFNYGVANFFSSGLESPLVQVLALCYALFIIDPKSRLMQAMVAVSPLARPELLAPLALCVLWAWRRQNRLPTGLIFLISLFNGLWLGFRVYYYADVFPNTFYLLDSVNVGQGLVYLQDTFGTYGAYYIFAIFLPGALYLASRRVDIAVAQRLMMLAAAVAVAAYVVKIGGSYFHYRYLAFPFILFFCSFAGLSEHLFARFGIGKYPAVALGLGLVAASTSFSLYPVSMSGHPMSEGVSVYWVGVISDTMLERLQFQKYRDHGEWGRLDDILANLSRSRENADAGYPYRQFFADHWIVNHYNNIGFYALNDLGLTDPILSRIALNYTIPAHKYGLLPYAADLYKLQSTAPIRGRGMYRRAVEGGKAPVWVRDNLDAIELIEKKTYNNHDIVENAGLAFS
jgi:hypothetical protein